MSASFEVSNYSIVSSFNETSIYVKAMDKVTFNCYENTIDSSELFISIDLEDAYKMMIKCFQGEDNHKVSIHIISDVMKLEFHAVLGGYLKMNFEILLREKIISNDTQLTINFQRMEQTYLTAIEKLTEKIDKLELLVNAVSNASITMTGGQNALYYPPVNAKEIVVLDGMETSKIKLFYQLEKITFRHQQGMSDTLFSFENIYSDTVTEIIMENMTTFNFRGDGGIQGCGFQKSVPINGYLNNFPNLTKISFYGCSRLNDIVKGLTSYSHKITYIKIQSNCQGMNNAEIMNYCHTNNITLEL